jgi:hypothetical protein
MGYAREGMAERRTNVEMAQKFNLNVRANYGILHSVIRSSSNRFGVGCTIPAAQRTLQLYLFHTSDGTGYRRKAILCPRIAVTRL